jgi:hypothetical protein
VSRRIPDDEPHPLIVTLAFIPRSEDELIVRIKGEEVPRSAYRLLVDRVTGQWVLYKPDSNWGECANISVQRKPRVFSKFTRHLPSFNV